MLTICNKRPAADEFRTGHASRCCLLVEHQQIRLIKTDFYFLHLVLVGVDAKNLVPDWVRTQVVSRRTQKS